MHLLQIEQILNVHLQRMRYSSDTNVNVCSVTIHFRYQLLLCAYSMVPRRMIGEKKKTLAHSDFMCTEIVRQTFSKFQSNQQKSNEP